MSFFYYFIQIYIFNVNITSGACRVCTSDQYLSHAGTCNALPVHCYYFDRITEVCISCNTNYEFNNLGVCVESRCPTGQVLDKDGTTCKPMPAYCIEYDSTKGACTKCFPTTFTVVDGICIIPRESKQPNCKDYNVYYNECPNCNEGWTKDLRGICVWKVCQWGYKQDGWGGCILINCLSQVLAKDGKSCIDIPNNCIAYNSQAGVCAQCKTLSLKIVNGQCQYDVSNCARFNSGIGKCEECSAGWFPDSQGLCSIQCQWGEVPNTSGTGCTALKCSSGNVMSKDGKICVPMPAFCQTYDSRQGVCSKCVPYYTIISSICTKINCDWGMVVDPAKEACVPVECPIGQVLTGDGINCFMMPAYCVEYNSLYGRCERCDDNHVLIKKVCTLISNVDRLKNCASFDRQSALCYQCQAGWAMDNSGVCLNVAKASSAAPLVGPSCRSDEANVLGVCLQKPPHCQTVSYYTGACTQCEASYQLKNSVCVYLKNCPEGQGLSANGNCQKLMPNCFDYDSLTGLCSTCANGVPPINNQCCPSGLSYIGGQCTKVQISSLIRNPELLIQEGMILTCIRYHPQLGTCIQCGGGGRVDPIDQTSCI